MITEDTKHEGHCVTHKCDESGMGKEINEQY